MNTKIRNWQKARIMGFNLQLDALSQEELKLYGEAMEKLDIIKTNWDYNTEKLIGHSLPPHKCYWCGKRQNVLKQIPDDFQRTGVDANLVVCTKHYKEYLKSNS